MLEIIVVAMLWKGMGEKMRKKGYAKPIWWQVLVPVCWLGGAFAGAFLFGFVRTLQDLPLRGVEVQTYLSAVVGAVLAVSILFLLITIMPRNAEMPPPLPDREERNPAE